MCASSFHQESSHFQHSSTSCSLFVAQNISCGTPCLTQNIMFDAEGTRGVVKVIDFGASQYVQPEETVRVQGLV